MKAVVATDVDKYSVEEVILDGPKAGEVKVKIGACGVCHSDLSVINGKLPLPKPIVLGHEGAGVIEELGEGVTGYEVGDHVVLSFVPTCGDCPSCKRLEPQFCSAGEPNGMMIDGTSRVKLGDTNIGVMQFLGCMAEYAVVPAISMVKIDKSIPLEKAALVGCGVMTGVGAALNSAKVTPGSRVAVFGCGGIGLSIIQGARLAGAAQIIAIDVADNKLEMAKKFGATHTVNGGDGMSVLKCKELTDGEGADFTFEAVGIPSLMMDANNAARRGGVVCIVGVGSLMETMNLNALLVSMEGKSVKGSFYGDANVRHDFPMLLDLYQSGKLNLDDMVSNTYSIDEAGQAIEDLKSGKNARGVIVF
ncbi:MAG: Zn-dependent alcohol dehydrogenase [Deltaproteobacteria bacterium]|nr:Zn-dependent alcohol dehydrogenase [Deltaproteobacteria bacterium]MBW2419914.1 Zn-dependent alcohol dehydrogenase [Deltaproteobacteria bacterium]